MSINSFNIRVYGLLINPLNQILLTDEHRFNFQFTKFPGGGLEFGEGTIDCLKREFNEELNVEIINPIHFYTTDFFQLSAFNKQQQVISIYYKVECLNWKDIKTVTDPFFNLQPNEQVFRWISLSNLDKNMLTFPIDKKVAEALKLNH